MIVFLLIFFVFLYAGLYMISLAGQPGKEQPSIHAVISDLIWMPPEKTVFFIFRGVILATAFYLLADFLISSVKRHNKKKSEPKDEPMVLKQTHPRFMDTD